MNKTKKLIYVFLIIILLNYFCPVFTYAGNLTPILIGPTSFESKYKVYTKSSLKGTEHLNLNNGATQSTYDDEGDVMKSIKMTGSYTIKRSLITFSSGLDSTKNVTYNFGNDNYVFYQDSLYGEDGKKYDCYMYINSISMDVYNVYKEYGVKDGSGTWESQIALYGTNNNAFPGMGIFLDKSKVENASVNLTYKFFDSDGNPANGVPGILIIKDIDVNQTININGINNNVNNASQSEIGNRLYKSVDNCAVDCTYSNYNVELKDLTGTNWQGDEAQRGDVYIKLDNISTISTTFKFERSAGTWFRFVNGYTDSNVQQMKEIKTSATGGTITNTIVDIPATGNESRTVEYSTAVNENELKSVVVDGTTVVTKGEIEAAGGSKDIGSGITVTKSYTTFNNITADHTITVNYGLADYTITYNLRTRRNN